MSICVVGAGIIGVSTAIRIQQLQPRVKVTLIADKFSPDTTSDVAAGFWRPFFLSDPRENLLNRWGQETFDRIEQLNRENPDFYGVGYCSGYELYDTYEPKPYWSETVRNFRMLDKDELNALGYGHSKFGHFFTSVFLESFVYLPVLTDQFQSNGGILQRKHLQSVDEIVGKFDVIVNCSGLGSYDFVGDKSCFPVRGQVYKVKCPGVKHFVVKDDIYVLYNREIVTIGGTHQEGNWSCEVDTNDSRTIWSGAVELCPQLRKAEILRETAGLRPGRPTVRLELETRRYGSNVTPIVHNYGHGGSGVTLHWGCAGDAAQLAVQQLQKLSKL